METKRHPEYQYLDLLQELLDTGVKNIDKGTGAVAYSLFGRQIRFDLSKGFPLLTTKKVYWRGVLEETYWFLSGQTNIKYLVDNNVHIWDDYPYKLYREKISKGLVDEMTKEEFIAKIASDTSFAKEYGELPGIYGEMWRHWPLLDGRQADQLQWMVNELRTDEFARNAIVTSWNPEYLYAMARPEKALRFPMCHVFYQCSVKNGKLSLQLYQRSADIFLGVPFNIASYSLLLSILAQVTGYEVGEFVHTFGDVHIYEDHIEQAKEQLSREPKPFSRLTIDGSVKEIDDFLPKHALLEEYDAHPPIKAELSPTGGVETDDWKKNWRTYVGKKN